MLIREDRSRNRLIGIGLVSGAFFCFAVLDVAAKWLARSLPVLEVVWLRFAVHVGFSAALWGPSMGWGLLKTKVPRLQLIRGLMLVVMTFLNFSALQYLQLTETGAIQFFMPILVALISAVWLGEQLDRGRWLAVIGGFAGVLIILRPGTSGFHPAMLLSLGNAVLYAVFNLMTRRIAGIDPPESTHFQSALVACIALLPLAAYVWETPATSLEWLLIAFTGLAGGFGHYLFARAHQYASSTVLSPFLYQQILYMALMGYVFFGDIPDGGVVLGGAIVIASGLFLILRNARLQANSR